MEPREELLCRVRRAYERGRIVRALRTSACVAPMVLASFGGCGKPTTSIAIGVVLATLAAFLVWRGGSAARAVTPGLVAGLASLAFPLVTCRALDRMGTSSALAIASCVLGGLASGAVVTWYAAHEREERAAFLLAGGGIAALAGSLGCLNAGLGGILAMAAGLLVVTPLGLRGVVRPS